MFKMQFDKSITFRTAWNQYSHKAFDTMPKNITKDYAFILQVGCVWALAYKDKIKIKDYPAIEKALTDMDRNNIPMSFARLMIHKTKFEA